MDFCMKIWISPERSRSLIKAILPKERIAVIRPAIVAVVPCFSSKLSKMSEILVSRWDLAG